MKLRVRSHFDAAHRLPRYTGDCARLHGHRWEVLVDLSAVVPASSGMAIDFKTAKAAIREALPDHQFLNDFYDGRQPEGEAEFNPTAENLAAIILHDIRQALPGYIEVIRFELFESPDCSVIIDDGEGHDRAHRSLDAVVNEIRSRLEEASKRFEDRNRDIERLLVLAEKMVS